MQIRKEPAINVNIKCGIASVGPIFNYPGGTHVASAIWPCICLFKRNSRQIFWYLVASVGDSRYTHSSIYNPPLNAYRSNANWSAV